MDETTSNQEDAALLLSDSGPLGPYPQKWKHPERPYAAHQSDER